MTRLISRIFGFFFCLIGLIGLLTPIPFGIVFFIIGLVILIPSTPSAAKPVRWARGKFSPFDRAMAAVTNKAPAPYRRILRQTETDIF